MSELREKMAEAEKFIERARSMSAAQRMLRASALADEAIARTVDVLGAVERACVRLDAMMSAASQRAVAAEAQAQCAARMAQRVERALRAGLSGESQSSVLAVLDVAGDV